MRFLMLSLLADDVNPPVAGSAVMCCVIVSSNPTLISSVALAAFV